jgi:methionine synthase II (cobalamin-independent)
MGDYGVTRSPFKSKIRVPVVGPSNHEQRARAPASAQTNADVITLECASTGGKDLALLGKHRTDKKFALGLVGHTSTAVEPLKVVPRSP